jgi:hypothetical protein
VDPPPDRSFLGYGDNYAVDHCDKKGDGCSAIKPYKLRAGFIIAFLGSPRRKKKIDQISGIRNKIRRKL